MINPEDLKRQRAERVERQNARVFITERIKYDVTSAKEFGRLCYLVEPDERLPSMWSSDYRARLEELLRENQFDPIRDYLLVGGGIVPMATCLAILASRHNWINCLCFDANHRRYISVTMGCNP